MKQAGMRRLSALIQYFVVSSSLLLASSGCTREAHAVREKTLFPMRKLNATEIATLLVGKSLVFAPSASAVVITSHYRERYLPNGSLVVEGDRAHRWGNWSLRGDEACISFQGTETEECRSFYVATDGSYYVRANQPDSNTKPTKIIVEWRINHWGSDYDLANGAIAADLPIANKYMASSARQADVIERIGCGLYGFQVRRNGRPSANCPASRQSGRH